MTKPKLSSKTPDDKDLNSLIDDHENLNAYPGEERTAIVRYIVPDRTIRTTGDEQARIQLTHFEGLEGRNLGEDGLKLLDKAFKKRTGKAKRPEPEPQLDMSALDEPADDLGAPVTPIK